MYKSVAREPRKGELSLLARGHGLLDGNVELECYSTQALSLQGEPFLKPSQSKEGQSAKIFKPHCLNLPKTYFTRRGQLMLFTAPEDMIIGQSCQVHEQEKQERVSRVRNLSRQAVKDLENTNNLLSSALCYEDSGISEGEGESNSPRLGNLTSTYVESLAKICQTNNESQSKTIEEIDGPLPNESDSGIDSYSRGTSGRLSALSNQSDCPTTSVIIPDEQRQPVETREQLSHQVRFDDNVDFIEADSEFETVGRKNELKDLMASLISDSPSQPSAKPSTGKSSTKKKSTGSAKKKPLTKDEKDAVTHKSKTCTPSTAAPTNLNKKNGKSVKRKAKKQKKATKEDETQLANEETFEQEITTFLSNEDDSSSVQSSERGTERESSLIERRQSARAEQRRLEIERKRRERKELEMERSEEKARQLRLLEEISSAYHNEPEDKENVDNERSILSLLNEGTLDITTTSALDTEVVNVEKERDVKPVIVKQEQTNKESEALRRVREMRERAQLEEMKRKQKLLEEQRLKQLEEEELLKSKRDKEKLAELEREQEIREAGKKLIGKEEMNYKMRLELAAQKYHERKTPPYLFSYFRYCPQKPKDKKKKSRTAMPRKTNKS